MLCAQRTAPLTIALVTAIALLTVAAQPAVGDGAAASPSPGAPGITEIAVEHGCFGCATGGSLVLRRDGTVVHTVTGNARHGTVDQVSTGSITAREFQRLATLLTTRGFFALKDEYGDPQIADGPWTSIAAIRDGREKKVFDRGGTGPAALRAIETELDAVKARLTLAPSPAP